MKLLDSIKSLFDGLPGWASKHGEKIHIDPDKAYPLYLDKLGHAHEPDQYWLEVARRCFTEDLHQIVKGPMHLVIEAKSGQWALRNFAEGAGAVAGANEFRQYYEWMNRSA